MTKILVTTDFSNNSKAALKFAIQIAEQTSASLTFFHSFHILKPTSFSDAQFEAYEKEETIKIEQQLKDFVDAFLKDHNFNNTNIQLVTKESPLPDSNILNYAENNNFDYICIASRGAGKIEKIFGTNTSNVLNKSSVPVIAVPNTYEIKPITKLVYSSDLQDLEKEIPKVIAFAKPLQLPVNVLNFSFPSELDENKNAKEKIEKLTDYPLDFTLKENNFQNTLVENITKEVEESNILVMFTNQNKPILDKLLFSGNSEDVAFSTKVPLIVFKKS